MPVADLFAQIMAVDAEGVTLLGGEPFEQAPALSELGAAVRAADRSLMTFTGYEWDELTGPNAPEGASDLLAVTDLLVSGRFQADAIDTERPWVGSTNQDFHFLTERYAHLAASGMRRPDRLEVRVGASGSIELNGWASTDQLETLLVGLRRRQ